MIAFTRFVAIVAGLIGMMTALGLVITAFTAKNAPTEAAMFIGGLSFAVIYTDILFMGMLGIWTDGAAIERVEDED